MKSSGARYLATIAITIGLGVLPSVGYADEVLDWNAVLLRAIRTASTPGFAQPRQAAIVHLAMFEALNGIERRFTPIYIDDEAPRGASRRAAIVYAAYTALVGLFPAQTSAFGADLEASLATIVADAAVENSVSIARGREWGGQVASEILARRATDGFDPTGPGYPGSLGVGEWRPTPSAFALGAGLSMAVTDPFIVPEPWTFRPSGPPSLTSAEYAAAVNEVKSVGESTSATRTADQTQSAQFWAGTALSFWNRAAVTAALQRHNTLTENARLFALLNVTAADAIITCWDSKYFFKLWRPITAIRLADTDGNAATDPQTDWTPLIPTPPYPDYYSGHQSISGSAQAILTSFFGNAMPVEGFSEGLPGVLRNWPNFASAADEASLARIWSGIHFRFAQVDSRATAERIAAYILEHAAQPLRGNR